MEDKIFPSVLELNGEKVEVMTFMNSLNRPKKSKILELRFRL